MLYLIIFILTVYLSTRFDPMYENITGVASLPQYRSIVIVYTLLTACFFAYKMLKIYKKIPISHLQRYQFIILLTAITMSIGSLFPYTFNGTDLFSKIHVYCSMMSCLSFLTLLFIYTRQLSIYQPSFYIKFHWFYDLSLQFLCILLIVFTRVNGYIEILFIAIVSVYLYIIEKYI